MRWNKPKLGDGRIVKGFLWFPKEINNEVRWLEKAEWKQVYFLGYWNDREWLDTTDKITGKDDEEAVYGKISTNFVESRIKENNQKGEKND